LKRTINQPCKIAFDYNLQPMRVIFAWKQKTKLEFPMVKKCDWICQEIHNDNDTWECIHRSVLSKIHVDSVDNTLTTLAEVLGDLVVRLT
jgi:hypothetical protein